MPRPGTNPVRAHGDNNAPAGHTPSATLHDLDRIGPKRYALPDGSRIIEQQCGMWVVYDFPTHADRHTAAAFRLLRDAAAYAHRDSL